MRILACLIASASILTLTPACSKKLYGFKKGQKYTEEYSHHAHWEEEHYHGLNVASEDRQKEAIIKKRWQVVEVGDDYIVVNRLSSYIVMEHSGEVYVDLGKAKKGDLEYNVRLVDSSVETMAEIWRLDN